MLSFTVEKLRMCSQASSMHSFHPTSPPLWIHREQACVSTRHSDQKVRCTQFKVAVLRDVFFITDSKVVLAIRRAEHLKRLVYVSCNAKAAMTNFIE